MTGGKSYWKNAVLTNGKILVLWKEENVKKNNEYELEPNR